MPSGGGVGGVGHTQMITIDVGGRALHASNRDLVGVMDDMNLGAQEGAAYDDDPDDLLGLMDEANER